MGHLVWAKDGMDWPNQHASQFVEAAGFSWHVQRMGQGVPLLLVHGTGAAIILGARYFRYWRNISR